MMKRTVQRAVLAAALLSPSVARAQNVSGWALDRFEPAPAGDAFFVAEHPWYRPVRLVAAGILGDYAIDPLRLQIQQAGQPTRTQSVVSGMFSAHVVAAVSPIDRLSIHLSLPVALAQSGEAAPAAVGTVGPYGGVALGDLRLGVRARIFGDADHDPFSLHLGVNVWLPTGSRDGNTGDGSVRLEPRLVLAGRAAWLRWTFGAGFQIASGIDALNFALGNELHFAAGLGAALLDGRLHVGPEMTVFSAMGSLPNGAGSAAFTSREWGGEVLVGARYLVADLVQLGAGGGFGIGEGSGVPAGRVMFSAVYATPAPRRLAVVDTDGDGIADATDQCPTVPAGAHPDPNRWGCPLGDADHDGVPDNEDACPTVPVGVHPDPAHLGCPLADRDGDGIGDHDDACPDAVPGNTPDPQRPGCPLTDRDGDGVFDGEDACPEVPAGTLPSTTQRGCPAPDADHDHIVDAPEGPDRCPLAPETFNGVDDEDGCPDGEAIAELTGTQVHISQQIRFRTNSDVIVGRPSFRVLDAVAAILRASPSLLVDVQGHTDGRGSPARNLDLSQRRAASVRRYLLAHDVPERRLESHGFGQTCPLDAGLGRAADRVNRRVQFVLVGPQSPAGRCVLR